LEDLQLHITDLLGRFTNAALQDTCQRVGGDPARKLSPEDRLIGSAKLALQQGITPAYIAVGAAAGVYRFIKESEALSQGMESAEKVLTEVSKLDKDEPLCRMILEAYQRILNGAPVSELRQLADKNKRESLVNVI
jgi:mannitol-1-phosphate 5-dehydrogenase